MNYSRLIKIKKNQQFQFKLYAETVILKSKQKQTEI